MAQDSATHALKSPCAPVSTRLLPSGYPFVPATLSMLRRTARVSPCLHDWPRGHASARCLASSRSCHLPFSMRKAPADEVLAIRSLADGKADHLPMSPPDRHQLIERPPHLRTPAY